MIHPKTHCSLPNIVNILNKSGFRNKLYFLITEYIKISNFLNITSNRIINLSLKSIDITLRTEAEILFHKQFFKFNTRD